MDKRSSGESMTCVGRHRRIGIWIVYSAQGSMFVCLNICFNFFKLLSKRTDLYDYYSPKTLNQFKRTSKTQWRSNKA